jgi:hypothetical protein
MFFCVPAVVFYCLSFVSQAAFCEISRTLAWNANPETDIAGYKVSLGTSSGIYQTVQTVVSGNSAILTGLSPETTYYCSVQAYNTSGLTSVMSVEITFITLPEESTPAEIFATWAAVGGLTGSSAAADAIPYHDGVSNLLKYAFNLDASGPDVRVLETGAGTAGLPSFSLERGISQVTFKVEFLRRKGSGLFYQPKVSTNLIAYEMMTGTSTVTSIDDEWERVIVRKPCDPATTPRMFGTVEVLLP